MSASQAPLPDDRPAPIADALLTAESPESTLGVGSISSSGSATMAPPAAPSGAGVVGRAIAEAARVAHLRGLPERGNEESGRDESVRRDTVFRRTLGLADVVGAATAVPIAQALTGVETVSIGVYLAIPLIVLVSKAIGLYDRDELVIAKTTLTEAPAVFQLATLYTLLITILLTASPAPPRPATIVVLWGLLSVGILLNRTLARRVARSLTAPERCLVLGTVTQTAQVVSKFGCHDGLHAEIVAYLPFEEFELSRPRSAEFASYVAGRGVERVIIAHSDSSERVHEAVRYFKSHHLKVSVLPTLLEVVGSSVEFDEVHGTTLLGVKTFGLSRSSALLKRVFDVAVALLMLIASAPLMVLIGLAIRLESRGPALFRQARVGESDRPFTVLKFRTMFDGAEQRRDEIDELNQTAGLFKLVDDPRVTRIGRFLRRTSLDELPQLFNVLRGEMSLVGPRPLVLEEDARVEGWHRNRLHLKPGMTGAWQVIGSVRVPLEEMAVMDYLYIVNWSPWSDAKILLQTVRHVLGARGV